MEEKSTSAKKKETGTAPRQSEKHGIIIVGGSYISSVLPLDIMLSKWQTPPNYNNTPRDLVFYYPFLYPNSQWL